MNLPDSSFACQNKLRTWWKQAWMYLNHSKPLNLTSSILNTELFKALVRKVISVSMSAFLPLSVLHLLLFPDIISEFNSLSRSQKMQAASSSVWVASQVDKRDYFSILSEGRCAMSTGLLSTRELTWIFLYGPRCSRSFSQKLYQDDTLSEMHVFQGWHCAYFK